MAFRISEYRDTEFNDINGTGVFDLDTTVFCDTASDLPGADDIEHYHLVLGCRAIDTSTGDKYYLTSSGNWEYDASGSGGGGGGGGGGTSNYNQLSNKPSIGGVQLIGDKSIDDLGGYTSTEIDQKISAIPIPNYLTTAQIDSITGSVPVTTGYFIPITPDVGETVDIDDYKTTGEFVVATEYISRISNIPQLIDSGFTLEIISDPANNVTRQEIMLINSSKTIYRRNLGSSDTWEDWMEFDGSKAPKLVHGDSIGCLEAFYFDSAVSCKISYSTYENSTNEEKIGIIVHTNNNFTYPIFISTSETAVAFSYNPNAKGSVTYNGVTWYYSNNGMAIEGDFIDELGNIPKYPDTFDLNNYDDSIIAVLEYTYAFPVS